MSVIIIYQSQWSAENAFSTICLAYVQPFILMGNRFCLETEPNSKTYQIYFYTHVEVSTQITKEKLFSVVKLKFYWSFFDILINISSAFWCCVNMKMRLWESNESNERSGTEKKQPTFEWKSSRLPVSLPTNWRQNNALLSLIKLDFIVLLCRIFEMHRICKRYRIGKCFLLRCVEF